MRLLTAIPAIMRCNWRRRTPDRPESLVRGQLYLFKIYRHWFYRCRTGTGHTDYSNESHGESRPVGFRSHAAIRSVVRMGTAQVQKGEFPGTKHDWRMGIDWHPHAAEQMPFSILSGVSNSRSGDGIDYADVVGTGPYARGGSGYAHQFAYRPDRRA